MKKHGWFLFLLSVVLMFGGVAVVRAEILPAKGEGQLGYEAVVLCESLTVREERGSSSKAVKTLHYGDTFTVQDAWDGWASCFTSETVDASQTGWVNSDYIIINPTWYRTAESTPVFAWNDTLAPRVALLSKDTVLPILKEEGEWLVVSLRGAAGWIYKTAEDRLSEGTAEMIRTISDLEKAELATSGKIYTLTDENGLKWIEKNFSIAQPVISTGCPFDATLTLYFSDGRRISLQMATDSCRTFRTEDGYFFFYGNGEEALRLYGTASGISEAFWQLFGLEDSANGVYGF